MSHLTLLGMIGHEVWTDKAAAVDWRRSNPMWQTTGFIGRKDNAVKYDVTRSRSENDHRGPTHEAVRNLGPETMGRWAPGLVVLAISVSPRPARTSGPVRPRASSALESWSGGRRRS